MSDTSAPPDRTRTRRLAVVVLGVNVVLTAIYGFAAADTGSGALFGLLAASTAAGAVAAMGTVSAAHGPTHPWVEIAMVALAASVLLLAAATTRDGGTVLPLAMLPLLLVEWWLLKGLRELRASTHPR